jgi:hypothetical protein
MRGIEIPNPKHQIPNKLQKTNIQIRKGFIKLSSALSGFVSVIRIWSLEFIWNLVLGIWCFRGSRGSKGSGFTREELCP